MNYTDQFEHRIVGVVVTAPPLLGDRMLRVVAVTGGVGDWAAYAGEVDWTNEQVKATGVKLFEVEVYETDEDGRTVCVDCSAEKED